MTDPIFRSIFARLWEEKLRLSKLFRMNASIKHGIPLDELEPVNVNINVRQKSTTVSPGEEVAESVTETDTETVQVVPKTHPDSVLQWLEDEGQHLP